MAYSYKKKENISNTSTEYSRYYGAFRGVDFSSDHTQVNESRLAYLVNMYKDYQSGQGEALETVAGFRQRAKFDGETHGIFYFKCKIDGVEKERVIVHSGAKLYLWHNYPYSINIKQKTSITAREIASTETVGESVINTYSQVLSFPCEQITSLKRETGEDITASATFEKSTNTLTFTSSVVETDEILDLEYYEGVSTSADILFTDMNERKSASFICNNRLYLIDGKNYLVFDGETVSNVADNATVPTTYIPKGADGDNEQLYEYVEYEQRNMLSPLFINPFIPDGTTKEFSLSENELDSIISVKVYGEEMVEGEDYTVDLENGKVIFTTAPTKPTETPMTVIDGETIYYERAHWGIEIIASKVWKSIDGVTQEGNIADIITGCTLCTTYDNRVFFSGNPKYHNHLFWCKFNSVSGRADPTYWGVVDFQPDGVGNAPITGLMCVSDTLMVLKADTQQDSAIYFHTGVDTNINVQPRTYQAVQGLSGLGCVGACRNFLDDPIFISRLGVEGVSQLKIAAERANEHRSKLIDAKLVNTDLSKACLEEWGGYLCLLTDGKIFLADSRQRYTDSTGAMQYEWYYLENIGVWDNQYQEYKYSELMAEELKGVKFTHDGQEYEIELAESVYYPDIYETKNLCGTVANEPNKDGISEKEIYTQIINVSIGDQTYPIMIAYTIHEVVNTETGEVEERHAYLCESRGNYTGGLFRKAVTLYSMSDNLFFGCENGVVCSFNFDQRDENGELPPQAYHFDNRTIFCGCATLMDNCQIPHLTKSTIKRSTVIKTKSFRNSAAKVKVRTNKKPYEQIARINSSLFSFNDVDFSDFSFITTDQSLFAIKEKEKQWVEKQYYIFSDEYLKPFSLYYVSYRYRVAGRYKNK